MSTPLQSYDLIVIGGGINGAGIAADASLRGLSVLLCEKNDLASGTSSKSSKLIHGGLRYLKYFDFRLVREALGEREVLMRVAPHLVKPLRFIFPLDHPRWYRIFIRAGLFLYDYLYHKNTLPRTRYQSLKHEEALHPNIKRGFIYSDCWSDDARLVIANAQQAHGKGAEICTRTELLDGVRTESGWLLTLRDTKTMDIIHVKAKAMVNAAGPWAERLITNRLDRTSAYKLRMVKGSHLIVKRWFETEHPYILEQKDGRVVFLIPYMDDLFLIGTTDQLHHGPLDAVFTTQEEIDYLFAAVNRYFHHPLENKDIVQTYAGIRPLCDDESDNPSAVTRDYTLTLEDDESPYPIVNIFGGKLTTYRKLAKQAVDLLSPYFASLPDCTTQTIPLPGGDLNASSWEGFLADLKPRFYFLPESLLTRYANAYGSRTSLLLRDVRVFEDMGQHFGADLYEAEVRYLVEHEWARTANDILKRRTKIGLLLEKPQRKHLKLWLRSHYPRLLDPTAKTESS